MVSSVSPDWLMTMTRSPLPTMGSLYRNSEARHTSTLRRSIRSRLYLPTIPTWYDDPQATMKILLMSRIC